MKLLRYFTQSTRDKKSTRPADLSLFRVIKVCILSYIRGVMIYTHTHTHTHTLTAALSTRLRPTLTVGTHCTLLALV